MPFLNSKDNHLNKNILSLKYISPFTFNLLHRTQFLPSQDTENVIQDTASFINTLTNIFVSCLEESRNEALPLLGSVLDPGRPDALNVPGEGGH